MIVVFYIELHDNMAHDHMTLAGLFEPGRGTPSAFARRLAGTLVCTAARRCPQLWDPMLSLHNLDLGNLCIDTSHVISYLTI